MTWTNRNTLNEYGYLVESNFAGVDAVFVLADSNQDADLKDSELEDIPTKRIIDDSKIINWKNFCGQAIGSDIKRYEEIRNSCCFSSKNTPICSFK